MRLINIENNSKYYSYYSQIISIHPSPIMKPPLSQGGCTPDTTKLFVHERRKLLPA